MNNAYYFCSILTWIFCVLPYNKSTAQVTYPKSILFGSYSPLSIAPAPQVQPAPGVIYQQPSPGVSMGGHANDIIREQNARAMQAMGYRPPVVPPSDPTAAHQFIINQYKQNERERQMAEYQALVKEDLPVIRNIPEKDYTYINKTSIYRNAFAEVMKMQRGQIPFSLKRLVFIVENAYLDTTMKYADYNKQIAAKTKLIKTLMKNERISSTNSLGINYIIQKLFSERVVEYKDTVVWRVHKPYQYDFDDFFGEKDWTKMFVSKLVKTGKGQCHSMPLLYLILAEEMKAKAWLSLAPEHSFVIFSDNNMTNFYNYETTIGSPTSIGWVMESGYINSNAIKSKIYLDTLGRDAIIAGCLADLVMGYTNKFGYDDFMASMVDALLQIYPQSIQGQIFKGDLLAVKLNAAAKKKRISSPQQFAQYPEINNLYIALEEQKSVIDDLGYAHMPKEKYEAWRMSLDDEKKRIERQKFKSIVISNAKGK